MGGHEHLVEPSGLQPNGLVHNAGPVMGDLDSERWTRAEERTAELISCIQPNQLSEERRAAVADYVQRLIVRCFPCQVFTFGSVPLKTYLPDGDIDLTAFSNSQNLKETWADQVRDILKSEEKNENAEFRVKEVQYIQAEVKIIKCLVENIVVDISFNQLGGLCTLCFLEEVDHLIDQNHLFKRSIILIKAWCYYESRILGAHHGLISTYALETLVLYIFHVYNNSFAGPLEVLYRFLEFFSKFDWENFCVSLWGPVPINSLPDVTAEPPRKDGGELLLSKLFLDACSSVYSVFPGGQENQGQPFVSKNFNVIDPLRFNNNLGRSVSRGNFFRIRSAFTYGAKRLARLLSCPEEELINEVNQFFSNTWDRHGSGERPDAPGEDIIPLRLPSPDQLRGPTNLKENCGEKVSDSNPSGNSRNASSQHSNCSTESASKKVSSNSSVHFEKGQRSSRPDNLLNEIQGRFLFARTRSSPELTDTYRDVSSRRSDKGPESGKAQPTATRQEQGRTSIESESPSLTDEALPVRHMPHQVLAAAVDTLRSSSGFTTGHELASVGGMQRMHQEEQDLVNMMASSNLNMPLNLASGHLPLPIPPSILASMGFAQRSFAGMFPPNMPFLDPSFTNMQFPQGLIAPPFTHYFPGMRVPTNSGTGAENFGTMEMNAAETDRDFWKEQSVASSGVDINHVTQQSDDNGQSSSAGLNSVSSSRSGKVQRKLNKENRVTSAENHVDSFPYQDNRNGVYSEDRTTDSRLSHSSSLRSKTSSESSWDGSPGNGKSTREKRGKRTVLTEPSTLYGKGKIVSDQATQPSEDERDLNSLSPVGRGTEDRISSPQLVGSLQGLPHLNGYELAQTSGSESITPFAPIVLGPDSRQRVMENSGGFPFAFYPTGPPVPFLTMLPFCNGASDNGVSETSARHFSGEEGLEGRQSFVPAEEENAFSSSRAAFGPSNELKPDILNSDFTSHWQNLQFGRYCQNPRPLVGPMGFPSPAATPPVYLQGRFPWDGAGRPPSANIFTQLMGYGPRMIPVPPPLQSVSGRPPNLYQRFVDEMPRHRSGTGTYLPNPKVSVRDRHSSNTRKGNYSYERTDGHGDREGNTKPRGSSRNHNRNPSEKSNSRVDRSENRADRYRHDPVPPFQAQNGPLSSNSVQGGPTSAGYGAYPNGLSANGPTVPPVVMVYPFDHNPNYGSQPEQLQFGSLGPVGPSVTDDQSQASEGNRARGAHGEQPRFRGPPLQRSSSDQASSAHIQRLAQRNYQLREEDFPPLASPNQVENDVWEKL